MFSGVKNYLEFNKVKKKSRGVDTFEIDVFRYLLEDKMCFLDYASHDSIIKPTHVNKMSLKGIPLITGTLEDDKNRYTLSALTHKYEACLKVFISEFYGYSFKNSKVDNLLLDFINDNFIEEDEEKEIPITVENVYKISLGKALAKRFSTKESYMKTLKKYKKLLKVYKQIA